MIRLSRFLANVLASSKQVRFGPSVTTFVRSKSTLTKPSSNNEATTPNVESTIDNLEKLYQDTLKLDVEREIDVIKLDLAYGPKYDEIYDKRKRLLDSFRKSNKDCFCPKADAVSNFWREVIRSTESFEMTDFDEKILSHLIDIRVKWYLEAVPKFVLYFYFEPNEFFNNHVLTKTYFLSCNPEEPGVNCCEGCKIDWKEGHQFPDYKQACFVDFFCPPELPDDENDPRYDTIIHILQNDFRWGIYYRDVLVSKALKFFTIEIANVATNDKEITKNNSQATEQANN